MSYFAPKRFALIRRLADTDQKIAAAESLVSGLEKGRPEIEAALESLRDLRQSAERMVVLLRAPRRD